MSLVAIRELEKEEQLMVVRQDVERGTSKDYRHAIALGVIRPRERIPGRRNSCKTDRHLRTLRKSPKFTPVRATSMRTTEKRGVSQRQRLSLGYGQYSLLFQQEKLRFLLEITGSYQWLMSMNW